MHSKNIGLFSISISVKRRMHKSDVNFIVSNQVSDLDPSESYKLPCIDQRTSNKLNDVVGL